MIEALRRLERAAAWLVLPLALLLLAQWPLRDWVQAGSRQANDAAQVLFGLFMAVAVAAAGRAGTHLASHSASPAAPWRRWAVLACIAPWALYLLVVSAAPTWQSLLQLERFPETLDPGYFLLRIAAWLLPALALAQALLAALRPPR